MTYQPHRSVLEQVRSALEPGRVYRRADLIGTSQLYNLTIVYNRKRHGQFRLGNRGFDFRVKPRFPRTLSMEFLFVDLLNNLDELAEDVSAIWARAERKVKELDGDGLRQALYAYGNAATRKRLRKALYSTDCLALR